MSRICVCSHRCLAAAALMMLGACGDNHTSNQPPPDAPDAPDAQPMPADAGPGDPDAMPEPVEWPVVESAIPLDPEIEAAVAELVSQMTLAQKVGQMVQAEIQSITPAQVKQYHIGSVLNGGGSWPGNNKSATAADWVALADAYYNASMDTSGGKPGEYLPIPILWGTDAVHGHSNVKGATLFPHNIGLGAANDPDLIERIASITAKEVMVTGIDWTFAPTLAVVRDDRWGRTYEGYSEAPEIVRNYAGRMVTGLQGQAGSAELFDGEHLIATAKHFLGDGGTNNGVDQGDTLVSEAELRDIHAQGYLTAIEAGVQTIMASFSSWQGQKMHGNRYLLTDILRGRFQFDGFVIGDWNGHGQVPGCDNTQCAASINAGVDMIMVPYDWQAFIANTIAQVEAGDISMARIDEAVTRILRVKMRSGLLGPRMNKGAPSTRPLAGRQELLGAPEHRAVAREAVRKSLVLLKNRDSVLPLTKSMRVLVAGKSADNLSLQSGGWTLTWQGTDNTNADFPDAQSIFAGIEGALAGGAGGSATLSVDGSAASPDFDAAIVVIGETPYAEGQGDIRPHQTLEHATRYDEDLEVLQRIRAQAPNLPIVTVFLSGRPLYVNRELNLSDAFVAAWLPGSEGGGVADVLFGDFEFTGKLPFSWPATDCQTGINRGAPGDDEAPLFAYGYGLRTTDGDMLGNEPLPEVSTEGGCESEDLPTGTTDQPLELFTGGANRGDYVLRIGGPSNWGGVDVGQTATLPGGEVTVTTIDGRLQGSAKLVAFTGTGQVYSQLALASPGTNLGVYANSESSIVFRVRVDAIEATLVNLSAHCVYPCLGDVPIGAQLRAIADGQWHEIRVPLQCLRDDGLDITNVNTPFLLYAEGGPLTLALEDIRWEPMTAGADPDCSVYTSPRDVIDVPVLNLYTNGVEPGFAFTAYMNDPTQQTDVGGGNLAWVGNLAPGTNISLHKNGLPADLSAYNTPTGRLRFDILVTQYGSDTAELLIKAATNWPSLSDVRLFSEILGERPALNVWREVAIPVQTLVASENDLAPGNFVDITNVGDVFVIESVGGAMNVLLDNIRWEK